MFHLMRSKGLEKWIQEQHSGRVREPLAYIAKVQVTFFHKDILKCCVFCPTPGTMGEKGAEKSEFYVPGVGTISGQAKMPE